MVVIIIAIPRGTFTGGVTTTGIILTGRMSVKGIITIASIMTGSRVTENITGITLAGNIPGPLIINSIRGLFYAIILFGISQYLKHTLRRLLLRVYPINHFTIAVMVNNYMLRGWDQAMLNASITTYLVLVRTRMKKSNVQRFTII